MRRPGHHAPPSDRELRVRPGLRTLPRTTTLSAAVPPARAPGPFSDDQFLSPLDKQWLRDRQGALTPSTLILYLLLQNGIFLHDH
jgi:hypothetical protein